MVAVALRIAKMLHLYVFFELSQIGPDKGGGKSAQPYYKKKFGRQTFQKWPRFGISDLGGQKGSLG